MLSAGLNIVMQALIITLLIFIFVMGIFYLFGALEKNKICTVTITDMRGVQHVIRGKSNE